MHRNAIYFFAFLSLFVSFFTWANHDVSSTLEISRKKVLIFMSKGGASHISGSNAIKGYLQNKYDISIVNFFEEIMPSIDLLRWVTFGNYSGEDFYNSCLKNRLNSVANGFATIGSWGISCFTKQIENLSFEYINNFKPDLIISVIPFVNGAIYNAAKKANVPFVVVTNDLDTTHYAYGLCKPDYKNFYYTLAFDEPILREKIAFAQIPDEKIKITGFPLRSEFFEGDKKNKTAIKKEFSVPENKKVIMILMGGAGSNSSFTYAKQLLKINTHAHVIICLGRNEKLKEQIEKLILPKHITFTILGFTNRIADLMKISDLLITKSGPGSLCEAIVSDLPVIIDKTFATLWWEQITVDLVEKYNLGYIARKFRDLPNVVDSFFSDQNKTNKIKSRMKSFRKKKNFGVNIQELADQILSD